MAKKKETPAKQEPQKPVKVPDDDGGILLPVLIALLGGIGGFLVVLFIGIGVGAFDVQQQTAAAPPAQSSRGTLPSATPVQTAAPTQTSPDEPEETQGAEPTQEPSTAPVQEPDAQTQAPAQTQASVASDAPAGNQGGGTISNGDGTYAHDFSGRRVLATTESNNNNDPVYHTKDCAAAKKIPPENELWYNSEQAAKDDSRRLCGNCGR